MITARAGSRPRRRMRMTTNGTSATSAPDESHGGILPFFSWSMRDFSEHDPVPASRSPSPGGIMASASAPSSEVRMCEPCGPFGTATVAPSLYSRRTRTACSRLGLRRTAMPSVAALRRPARAGPWRAASAGRANSANVTDGRHRIAGQPEYQTTVAGAEPRRLAWLQGHTPEHLFDAQRRERRLDVIVRADRYAAGDDDDVGAFERLAERGLGDRAVVGKPRAIVGDRAAVGRQRRQHRSV